MAQQEHTAVLTQELIYNFAIHAGLRVADATLGFGGHAQAIMPLLGPEGVYIGIDRDGDALQEARQRLSVQNCTSIYIEGSFRDLPALLQGHGVPLVDRVLVDLGWGTHQMHTGRGFSYAHDEPLLLSYATDREAVSYTARDIVNTWKRDALIAMLRAYSDERFAQRIADHILEARAIQPIETSGTLAAIVARAVPKRFHISGKHPATKTFQALRIAVNDELGALEALLAALPSCMATQGRVAIITFHSKEDAIVKQAFLAYEKEARGARHTKKPLVPTLQEVRENYRSRSAKLRIFNFV